MKNKKDDGFTLFIAGVVIFATALTCANAILHELARVGM